MYIQYMYNYYTYVHVCITPNLIRKEGSKDPSGFVVVNPFARWANHHTHKPNGEGQVNDSLQGGVVLELHQDEERIRETTHFTSHHWDPFGTSGKLVEKFELMLLERANTIALLFLWVHWKDLIHIPWPLCEWFAEDSTVRYRMVFAVLASHIKGGCPTHDPHRCKTDRWGGRSRVSYRYCWDTCVCVGWSVADIITWSTLSSLVALSIAYQQWINLCLFSVWMLAWRWSWHPRLGLLPSLTSYSKVQKPHMYSHKWIWFWTWFYRTYVIPGMH